MSYEVAMTEASREPAGNREVLEEQEPGTVSRGVMQLRAPNPRQPDVPACQH
jgi:hypothetical protein